MENEKLNMRADGGCPASSCSALKAKAEAMRSRMKSKGIKPLPDHIVEQTLRDIQHNKPLTD